MVAYSVASGVIYLLAEAGLPVDSTSTSLLLVLMFGAGTDYCLLLVARYRANLRAGQNVEDAVGRALPQAAPAMIASAVTVIAAMLAMLAGVLGLNRTLGPVNAIGIAIVLLASLTLLPAVLAVTGERAFWPAKPDAAEKAGGVWQRLGERVRRRPARMARGGRARTQRVCRRHLGLRVARGLDPAVQERDGRHPRVRRAEDAASRPGRWRRPRR